MALGASPPLTPDSVAETARAAALAAIPPFAGMTPKPEGLVASPGTADMLARPDHVHPRLTSASMGKLDANGDATITYTQVFDAEPAVTVISKGAKAAGWAVPDFDVTPVKDASGKFVGCTVYGRRARRLPAQPLSGSPLGLLAALGTVITGVNAIAASITGYDATEPAANAEFYIIAVKSSAV
jgi:hypothetical protein